MPAFKKFGPIDQTDNVLVLEPAWNLVSGSDGWRGSPEGSASLSAWGGYNRKPNGVVQSYKFQRIIPGTNSFGILARSEPITASVQYIWMTDESLNLAQRTDQRWGHEHWKTIGRLYDYYSRKDPDYTTSSYDYYCLYFNSGSQNILTVHDEAKTATSSSYALPTGSFTLEAWFNPLTVSSTGTFTILSHRGAFNWFINGQTGKLAFVTYTGSNNVLEAAMTTVAASVAVTPKRWHHAAVTYDATTLSGAMYLDLVQVASFTLTSSIRCPTSYTGALQIGGRWGGGTGVNNDSSFYETPQFGPAAEVGSVFHGFMGEVRVWGVNRTWAQISSSYNHRISPNGYTGSLLSYVRMNEGPLVVATPITGTNALPFHAVINGWRNFGVAGSGVLDHAAIANGKEGYGVLYSFDDINKPVWHPCDNVLFYPGKSLAPVQITGTFWNVIPAQSVQRMIVLSVPGAFHGRNIVPNSVQLTCQGYSDPNYTLIRTLIDDGRGNLFLSGSAASGTYTTGSSDAGSYRGVEWPKVGNVFYSEGLVVIRDPALLDFGMPDPDNDFPPSWNSVDNLLQFSFKGQSRIPVKTLMCRIDRGELNSSLNPTYWDAEEDGTRVRVHPSGNLYVTTVGLYNSDHELVGVARLAEPLRVRPRDRMNVRLRMDF